MSVAIDNDVLIKTTAFRLLDSAVGVIAEAGEPVEVLGQAQYVVLARLKKLVPRDQFEAASSMFSAFLRTASSIEPTEAELKVAAALEADALDRSLPMDSGESTMCAIALSRGTRLIATGDKRAIGAIQTLLGSSGKFDKRLLCLEQVFQRLLRSLETSFVRRAVCEAPNVDHALRNCFACASPEVLRESIHEGLVSHINSVRGSAPTVLAID